MQRQIPNAKLELFEGGHLFFIQDPRAFQQIASCSCVVSSTTRGHRLNNAEGWKRNLGWGGVLVFWSGIQDIRALYATDL